MKLEQNDKILIEAAIRHFQQAVEAGENLSYLEQVICGFDAGHVSNTDFSLLQNKVDKAVVLDDLYIISGRYFGDDDDSVQIITSPDLGAATLKFKDSMCEDADDDNEEDGNSKVIINVCEELSTFIGK